MRTTLLALILLLPVLAIANGLYFGSQLVRLLSDVRVLASTHDLVRFKRVVALQMYAALAQVALLAAPLIVFLYGLKQGVLSIGEVVYVIVPAAVVMIVGLRFRAVELAVRELPAADDELRRERDRVVQTWISRPFPDWE